MRISFKASSLLFSSKYAFNPPLRYMLVATNKCMLLFTPLPSYSILFHPTPFYSIFFHPPPIFFIFFHIVPLFASISAFFLITLHLPFLSYYFFVFFILKIYFFSIIFYYLLTLWLLFALCRVGSYIIVCNKMEMTKAQ